MIKPLFVACVVTTSAALSLASIGCSGSGEATGDGDGGDGDGDGDGDVVGVGGTIGAPGVGGNGPASGGSDFGTGGSDSGAGGSDTGTGGAPTDDCEDTGAPDTFSFFLTSYHHIQALAGSPNGFGGDLRYGGATTGLDGADAICQEIARRVCFGHKTWRAYLSTSTVNAITRIGSGPWYDYAGNLVASNTAGLTSDDRPAGGCCDDGVFDELGVFHDGSTDVNNDGMDDDDHDTLTATREDGTYSGFSCDDWTSTTATSGGGGGPGQSAGPLCGHSWPANSGQGWSEAHGARGCAAGVNFEQNGPGTGNTVGAGGGYGGIYCFAQ